MTRINLVPAKLLLDKHLVAEHREIKRLRYYYGYWKGQHIPTFRLGTGHIHFFMDKGQFTYERYLELHAECHRRKFLVTNFSSFWDGWRAEHYKPWQWTPEEAVISQTRIMERLPKQLRYYRQTIPKYDLFDSNISVYLSSYVPISASVTLNLPVRPLLLN